MQPFYYIVTSILLIIIILLILITIILLTISRTDHVRWVGARELEEPYAAFGARLNALDCSVRGCESPSDCRRRYLAGVLDPATVPEASKVAVQSAVEAAQRWCKDRAPWLQSRGVWKVALLRDDIENGWPHTLGDVICLPLTPFLRRSPESARETMVHERVHVFQRSHPEAARRFIVDRLGQGYTGESVAIPATVASRTRANPDLDGRAWIQRNHLVRLYVYDDDAYLPLRLPSNLTLSSVRLASFDPITWEERGNEHGHDGKDDGNDDGKEHPYEAMAYYVAAIK